MINLKDQILSLSLNLEKLTDMNVMDLDSTKDKLEYLSTDLYNEYINLLEDLGNFLKAIDELEVSCDLSSYIKTIKGKKSYSEDIDILNGLDVVYKKLTDSGITMDPLSVIESRLERHIAFTKVIKGRLDATSNDLKGYFEASDMVTSGSINIDHVKFASVVENHTPHKSRLFLQMFIVGTNTTYFLPPNPNEIQNYLDLGRWLSDNVNLTEHGLKLINDALVAYNDMNPILEGLQGGDYTLMNEAKWHNIAINYNSTQTQTVAAVLIKIPNTDWLFWHPSKLVRTSGSGGFRMTISFTDTWEFNIFRTGKGKFNSRKKIDEKTIKAAEMIKRLGKGVDN